MGKVVKSNVAKREQAAAKKAAEAAAATGTAAAATTVQRKPQTIRVNKRQQVVRTYTYISSNNINAF